MSTSVAGFTLVLILGIVSAAGVQAPRAYMDMITGRTSQTETLSNNLAFIDGSVARNVISCDELSAFTKKQAPDLAKNVA